MRLACRGRHEVYAAPITADGSATATRASRFVVLFRGLEKHALKSDVMVRSRPTVFARTITQSRGVVATQKEIVAVPERSKRGSRPRGQWSSDDQIRESAKYAEMLAKPYLITTTKQAFPGVGCAIGAISFLGL